jgi:hypothetical protein
MKSWAFLVIGLLLFGCSPYKDVSVKKNPGHHIHSKDKNAVKENMKLQKEQAKTAQKKRDELTSLNGSSTNSENLLKKKKKK